MSTHVLQPLGAAALARWGLLDGLAATAGAHPFDQAMDEYQRARDQHVLPMYEFTCQLATLQPPSPEMRQLFGAMRGNQEAMDGFVQMNSGTISPAEFLSPKNISAIMAARSVLGPTMNRISSSSVVRGFGLPLASRAGVGASA